MSNIITGLFDLESSAEAAVNQLKQLGYNDNEVSIIMKDPAHAKALASDTGTYAMADIGTGAAVGGTIGAVLAGLLAVGSVTIPGIGLVAAGSIAALLAGAGAGGIAGGIIGWLTSLGVPSDVAPYYERGIESGGVVVAVACRAGDEGRVRQVLQGASVAYSGYNTPSHVERTYASRYSDLTPPTSYDSANSEGYHTSAATGDLNRTANEVNAADRDAVRTAAEHESEARRDLDRSAVDSEAAKVRDAKIDRESHVL